MVRFTRSPAFRLRARSCQTGGRVTYKRARPLASKKETAGKRFYWQLVNLTLPINVLQLNVPLLLRYSVVYQNVQSSVGSTLRLL